MGVIDRRLLALAGACAIALAIAYFAAAPDSKAPRENSETAYETKNPVPFVPADPDMNSSTNPIVVTAADLGIEFEQNAVKANDTYRGQFLKVRGPVESVDEGGYGHTEQAAIKFDRLGIGSRVTAYVSRDAAASVQAGRGIELICLGAHKEIFVELPDCRVSRVL